MINVKNSTKLSVEITNGRHVIKSDVSEKNGGDDSGLNPHELLEASLGACTNITVLMYAKLKDIPLRDIQTRVQVTGEGDENQILREITFFGDLDASQRERLMKIANKCPMHNFLAKKSQIETREI